MAEEDETDELVRELSAVTSAIMDKEDEKKMLCQPINFELKKLKKRQRAVRQELKTGKTQRSLKFSTQVAEVVEEERRRKGEPEKDAWPPPDKPKRGRRKKTDLSAN